MCMKVFRVILRCTSMPAASCSMHAIVRRAGGPLSLVHARLVEVKDAVNHGPSGLPPTANGKRLYSAT